MVVPARLPTQTDAAAAGHAGRNNLIRYELLLDRLGPDSESEPGA
jgi:hypothetical protein